MRREWKIGRMGGWGHRRRTIKFFSFQSSTHPSFRSSGFSLLEVLVALAVFGIAAGGVLVALGHHLKNVSFMKDHARAVRIASREINALRRTGLLEEETEGSEDRFTWTTLVTTDGLDEWPSLENASGTPVLLNVTVQWSDSEESPPNGRVRLHGFGVFGVED